MIVLDTNVISELMRPHPSPLVVAWVAAQPRERLYTTSINRAEILYGIALLPVGRRRQALEAGAENVFDEEFAGRVLPFDDRALCQDCDGPTGIRAPDREFRCVYCGHGCRRRLLDRNSRRRWVRGLRSRIDQPLAGRSLIEALLR